MTTKPQKVSRKQQILECLASMLEQQKGARITTANLAAEVGVSEAALYRHFPSKARMFESLIEFIEETIFSRINAITLQANVGQDKIEQVMALVITFAAKNPGISRILTGEALTGEQDRLRTRIAQFFNRLEVQLKQLIREQAAATGSSQEQATEQANLLVNIIDGRLQQYVRSDFKRDPLEHWQSQWHTVRQMLTLQSFESES
jgi:TetR/AcrR family transcriptional regulator